MNGIHFLADDEGENTLIYTRVSPGCDSVVVVLEIYV